MAKTNKRAVAKAATASDMQNERKTAAINALRPSVNAAAVVMEYSKATFGEQDINLLIATLSECMDEVKNNNLSRAENMLLGQAHALQAIFMNLSRRAIRQDHLKQFETHLRLALKAQNQCRMTLETLATIKNPPIVYAKQANIAHGHQQVNNAASPPSHAAENKTAPNELLEAQAHGNEWLDTRAPQAASTADTAMAAVDKSHRRKNG